MARRNKPELLEQVSQAVALEGRVRDLQSQRDALRAELGEGRVPAPCAGCELGRYAITPKWKLVRVAARGAWNRVFGRLPVVDE